MSVLKFAGRSPGTLRRLQDLTIINPHCAVGFVSSAARKSDSEDKDSSMKNNPFYDKYSKKISELHEKRYEDIMERLKAVRNNEKLHTHSSKRPSVVPSFTRQQNKLSDVIKKELLQDKTAEEISEMWMKLHHQVPDCVASVISSATYCLIEERGLQYPTFLLPLPRSKGYEFIVSQFNGSEVHFTPLISYQMHKENAPECLSVKHYVELEQEKGIVLIKGEFNKDVINCTEAVCLFNQLQRYYGEKDDQRLRLLARFNESPIDFQHIDLIVELERLAR